MHFRINQLRLYCNTALYGQLVGRKLIPHWAELLSDGAQCNTKRIFSSKVANSMQYRRFKITFSFLYHH